MENDGIITATLDVYVTERGAYKNTLICSDPVDYKETVPPTKWNVEMKPMPRVTQTVPTLKSSSRSTTRVTPSRVTTATNTLLSTSCTSAVMTIASSTAQTSRSKSNNKPQHQGG